MKQWEDLTLLQKILLTTFLIVAAIFVPEIAILLQFGGIEVTFVMLLVWMKPIWQWLSLKYQMLQVQLALIGFSIRHSASVKPRIFLTQASFCCIAFFLTGSVTFAFSFFMPGMLFNSTIV
ncbi:hypothetical protein [Shewanella nanhaiensis]|uniref:Uncharacterized protein n=1 Tax=Shewanella nanhaiensis TaxID=2864872 RepID=A0ABS7DZ98_9GAMM|nr:hypothetical protein [Shewanella nanhaiensis]MBW8182736.1 hypothetical protein [Shewanella nanhaiensis]